ncbi:MAG: type I-U CRISPR-associated protein Cas7 [Boseongicola sp. SB0670_bin_30]|nr:type I-U CRISPR-associated protein Cas7 [Boseongicola sp. SB0670_bin_30]
MPLDFSSLNDEPRLLIEAELEPVQGDRFQPTGFPNLGHARYESPDGGGAMILVESAQSMANRLEAVCWDEVSEDWVGPLKGLPYVKVVERDGDKEKFVTSSILEAHRINSEYIARSQEFKETVEKMIGFQKDRPFEIRKQLVPALLKFDINSLIHGVFLEEVAGVIRLPRVLSAFIEANDVKEARSGGVKLNRVEPSLKEGEGNVPYPRDEWVAANMVAYFNVDLRQIYAFGLGDEVRQLLIALALFKIQKFLTVGLRLRTACDLDLTRITVTRPKSFTLPDLADLEAELPELIESAGAKGLFGEPRVLTVTYRK